DVLKERKYRELKLYIRPSLKPIIVPKVRYGPQPFLCILLFFILKRMKNQCIVFVSTRKECTYLYYLYRIFFSCTYVYSDLDRRDENIRDFKDKKYRFIFATTVLERGITIKDVNVVVMNLHKGIFAEENIIQMLGRVGRNYANPYGEAYILSRYRTRDVTNSVSFIKEANEISEMSLLR
ncbi:MAG: hypothetical protein IKE38_01075, partial [Erysipelotrichaceae bacterium]|nr:hypothetical protein [Erysipelotrichaceae bacterium]